MASESSPSPRTCANIRLSCSPAKAGVHERGALHFHSLEPDTLLRSVLGPGLRRVTAVKQINVWPLLVLLIVVVFLVIWLKP
jgi:hypothetical protein